jgi:hypothetical protein
MEDGFRWLRKGLYIFGSVISVDVCTKLIKTLQKNILIIIQQQHSRILFWQTWLFHHHQNTPPYSEEA